MMASRGHSQFCLFLYVSASAFVVACTASAGDQSDDFQTCLKVCGSSGSVMFHNIPGCSPVANPVDPAAEAAAGSRQVAEPWELRLTRWDCAHECRYQCMVHREAKRAALSQPPSKYFGKWPFYRILGMQEPASVLFSVLNFLVTLWGLLKYIHLVYWKLPRKPMGDKGPLYDYASLWVVYGLMSLNSWFWSAVFHTRDTPYTEAWDYSSAIALIAALLILAIIRTASLRLEAARVMVSAPIIGFTTTHILYLNFYKFDYGWNIKVCTAMGILQLLCWVIWGYVTKHPARVKLWVAVIGTALAMLLELYDFPPKWGVLDAHACWHAATIPLIFLWWSFVRDDASERCKILLRKDKAGEEKKSK